MKRAGLLMMSCILIVAAPAIAQPRESVRWQTMHKTIKTKKIAVASADVDPPVRIRGDNNGQGLSQQAFSRWIIKHPALLTPKRTGPSMRIYTSTAPAKRTEEAFFSADLDRDGRVSPTELADFVSRPVNQQASASDPV